MIFLVDNGLHGLGIRPQAAAFGSPEQQGQTDVAATADILQPGRHALHAVNGQLPPQALGRESGLEDLIPAREVNGNVEPYLSILASRAMSLRTDARFDSAVDFASALARPPGHPEAMISPQRRTPDPPRAAPPPRQPQQRRRQMERRTIIALALTLLLILVTMIGFGFLDLERPAAELSEAEATATFVSAVIAAATQLAPTPTLTPPPTTPPTPTPAPFVSSTGARMILLPPRPFSYGAG